jgi:hypothetical protein
MSQRINVITLCDIDEDDSKSAVRTTISVDGATVEIDLCDEHRAEVDAMLEPLFAVGRRSGRRRSRATTATAVTVPAQSSGPKGREERNAIRQWAQANGLKVGDRGRIAEEIVAAYKEAH